jgi:hypothetical protein
MNQKNLKKLINNMKKIKIKKTIKEKIKEHYNKDGSFKKNVKYEDLDPKVHKIKTLLQFLETMQKKWYDTKNEEQRTELGIQIIELKEEINQLNK